MSYNFISLNNDAVFSGINLSTRQMPLNPLGNKEVEREINNDTEELARTQSLLEFGSKIAESQKTDTEKQPEGNVPWADIMRQLELKCSGDEEEDFNNIMEEIKFQIENAQTQYDLNYYQWLMEHTHRLFLSLEDAKEEYIEDNFPYENLFYQHGTINMTML